MARFLGRDLGRGLAVATTLRAMSLFSGGLERLAEHPMGVADCARREAVIL